VISCGQISVVVEGMLEIGIKEITLADTAGLGNPRQVYTLVRELSAKYPEVNWALHFHDTRGLGLANIIAGIQAGVTTLESSVGGLGGCPFMPGVAGNVPTEDLVFMLHSMGIRTSINLEGIIRCTRLLEAILGRSMPARVSHLK
jgi:hydroxymethylglutaryl-CoA lyase